MKDLYSHLTCPIEGERLYLEGRTLRCPMGHSFDIAREGYVNLLPVQNKRSKDPGDSKEMVAARRRFLHSNVYEAIAEKLSEAALNDLPDKGRFTCLDAGCGEGYYLRHLKRKAQTRELDLIGLDISKWAVISAAKLDKHSCWIVGSNSRLPLVAGTVDRVICMFGFPVYEEFLRVLAPGGRLIVIEPAPDHLRELREIIYPSLKPAREPSNIAPDGFELLQQEQISLGLSLQDPQYIKDLLLMTPHFYRATAEGREKAASLKSLDTTIHVEIRTLLKL
jgi:23S rRNA (guanine745-N1)-methyltransferase